MTFHLDVLDGSGQSERVTFSTLYDTSATRSSVDVVTADAAGSATASINKKPTNNCLTATTNARKVTLGSGSYNNNNNTGNNVNTNINNNNSNINNDNNNKKSTAAEAIVRNGRGAGGESNGSGGVGGGTTALARRGGAIRCPIKFDVSRSRGWTVIAVDMDKLMLDGRVRRESCTSVGSVGRAGVGKGYRLLRGVRLGSNMVVRGVYASDTFYAPQTLPKEMSLPLRGGGAWDAAYGWLWLPEVRDSERYTMTSVLCVLCATKMCN